MKTIFAFQRFPRAFTKSLYLAGPTPRNNEAPSWRLQALELLSSCGYDDVIFVPELPSGDCRRDYDRQMDWELEAMRRSDIIIFWIPADKEKLPATTTRVEFGLKIHTGRIVLGMPKDAYKTGYLEKLAERYGVVTHRNLEAVVIAALRRLEAGAERIGAECLIPLDIWRSTHFQQWYEAHQSSGHVLKDIRNVEWVFRVGPNKLFPLFIALHVAIEVSGENRIKDNEVVIMRPSVVKVCAYCLGEHRENDRFLLVQEYRTPVMNERGFVFELPGGSSFNPDVDPIDIAIDELKEETGVNVGRERFRILGRRQIAATMIANEAVLLAARLESAEMDEIAGRQGEMHGNIAKTERTYLCVFTRQQIIEGDFVDYATLGQLSLIGNGKQ